MRRYAIAIAVGIAILGAGLGRLWAGDAEPAKPKGDLFNIEPRTLSTQGNARWIYYLVNTFDLAASSYGEAPVIEGQELDMTRLSVSAAPGGTTVSPGTIQLLAGDGSVITVVYINSFGTQQFTFDPPIPVRAGYKLRFQPTTGVPSYGNWYFVLSGYVPGMPRFASGVAVQ